MRAAQLVAVLPVNDTQGQTHSGMPALSIEQDYHDYITSRLAAWTAARCCSAHRLGHADSCRLAG